VRKLLGQILKEMGVLHEGHVQEALVHQREAGCTIGKALRELGHITEEQLTEALGRQAGMEPIDLAATSVTPEAAALVDANTARLFRICPVRLEGDGLLVAMADPLNKAVLDDLRFTLGREVTGAIASESAVQAALDRVYGVEKQASAGEVFAEAAKELRDSGLGGGTTDLGDAEALAQSAPVVKLLNYILLQAIRDHASDIHLEPFERDFKIRYRVDGALFELESPPRHLAEALISRVKVMSHLDIAETRIPQDGRIELSIAGRPVDIRVSTLPTMFGESCVMRVLDRSVVSLDLLRLGMREKDVECIRSLLKKPHGIILVTGPTGSGKTTSLYSALNEANDVGRKIITTEDPVEYDLEGIIQVQINEEIGVTYASCLRSILRQDPDMILVGEIRDQETAQIAIEASLTGHVVFSTLHTNDAPSAVTRMIDIGVEPFLLSATLEAVVAQRLVRRVCTQCKELYEPTDDVLRELELTREEVEGARFAMGRGCDACHRTGYKGRMGLFEIIMVTDRLRNMIVEGASGDRLREAARQEGMTTLREGGLLALQDGFTSVEEVVRETMLVR
jgi:type IV pilus assembly protein PilB